MLWPNCTFQLAAAAHAIDRCSSWTLMIEGARPASHRYIETRFVTSWRTQPGSVPPSHSVGPFVHTGFASWTDVCPHLYTAQTSASLWLVGSPGASGQQPAPATTAPALQRHTPPPHAEKGGQASPPAQLCLQPSASSTSPGGHTHAPPVQVAPSGHSAQVVGPVLLPAEPPTGGCPALPPLPLCVPPVPAVVPPVPPVPPFALLPVPAVPPPPFPLAPPFPLLVPAPAPLLPPAPPFPAVDPAPPLPPSSSPFVPALPRLRLTSSPSLALSSSVGAQANAAVQMTTRGATKQAARISRA